MKYLQVILGAVIFATLTLLLAGLLVKLLWNYALVPQGLNEITVAQGAALVALTNILFNPLNLKENKK